MASEREVFGVSGPWHLNPMDWGNAVHRFSLAASLVQGVYVLEKDRQQSRRGHRALAPPWWEHFHFQLNRVVIDEADLSVFGAVYEYKHPLPTHDCFNPLPTHDCFNKAPPRYVIAFRGTITKLETRTEDFKLDLMVIANKLEESSRFCIAMQAIQNIVAQAGTSNVWLAGHSLGSAIALLAGKSMAKCGCYLETYLFNPPFASAPIGKIKNEKLKIGVRLASSLVTASLAAVLTSKQKKPPGEDAFRLLTEWAPYIFVNPSDPICAEYIGYFEHRERMNEIGAGAIERLATKHSVGSLFSSAMGRGFEPMHLIPSAHLTVNLYPVGLFKAAHGIHQWWQHHFQWQTKLHKFN